MQHQPEKRLSKLKQPRLNNSGLAESDCNYFPEAEMTELWHLFL